MSIIVFKKWSASIALLIVCTMIVLPDAAHAQWIDDGLGNISHEGGNVAIGLTSSAAKVGIEGDDTNNTKALLIQTNSASTFHDQIAITSSLSTGYGIAFAGQSHHRGGIYAINKGGYSDPEGEIHVWARNNGNIILEGTVGIGIAEPEQKLDVRSPANEFQIRMSDYTGGEYARMGYFNGSEQNQFILEQTAGNEVNSFFIKYAPATSSPVFQFETNTHPEALVITESGKIGIGTASPEKTLHVEGNAKVSGDLTLGGALTSNGPICIGNCE